MQSHFTDIVVIYNPNSTGPGKNMAQKLQHDISDYKVRLIETEYGGHAEKLAYENVNKSARPLIISASGDGGYHEVINGLVRALKTGANPTAGLLPAGNANDHFHDVHRINLVEAIAKGAVQQIDLLKVTTSVKGKPFERYAHSYIGFGLTPKVGAKLNQVNLNWLNEIIIVFQALFTLQPVTIVHDETRQSYDSLIFSNIRKMSKVLSLSDNASNSDGKFEITTFKRRNKLRLLKLLLKASTSGLEGSDKNTQYSFKTIKKVLMQIDGEISTVDPDSEVFITIETKSLKCIV